jgi:hypothetical protein
MSDDKRLFLRELEVIFAIVGVVACIGVIVRTMQGRYLDAAIVLVYAIILAALVYALERWRKRE